MRRISVLLLVMLLPALTSAQGFRNQYEWSIAGIYQNSESTGTVGGSGVEIDNALGFGFSFNYLFNENFALGADIDWLSPRLRRDLDRRSGRDHCHRS